MGVNLRRKAYDELLKWKAESDGSTAILINGARRVGKSHLAEEFAKNEYRSHLKIDFSDVDPKVIEIFERDSWDRDTFFEKLSVAFNVRLYRRQSVIIFDEVQQYPPARQLIKHLVADGRYDYIETSSLLSISANTAGIVIPSEEQDLILNPLDFEEFLWAMGDEVSADYMRECFKALKPLGEAPHRRIMNLFRKYILVGGMPQAVIEYISSGEFQKVDSKKRCILSLYYKDISKFAEDESKVRGIFDSMPAQLSKKEKKFNLASVDKSARNREYRDSFMWLVDGMIVNRCLNSTDPSVGLSMNSEISTQKLYMADTGLLVTKCLSDNTVIEESIYKSILLDKISINEGMLAENVVAQTLKANGHNLFFYSRYRRTVTTEDGEEVEELAMEIDFLIRREGKICPVEVKTGRLDHPSLDKFNRKFGKRLGQSYILCMKDVQVRDGIVILPMYMAMLL